MDANRKLAKASNYLYRAFQTCRQGFGYVGLFSFCINLLMLTVPIYMMQLFDRVIVSRSYDTLIFLSVIAVIALVVMATLDVTRSRILIKVSEWLDGFLTPNALARSADEILAGKKYHAQSLQDINRLRQFISSPGIFALFDSPWVPIYLCVIFMIHPILGGVALAGAVILFGLAMANELMTRQPLIQANTLSAMTQSQAESTLRNAEVIQALGMMPNIIHNWRQQNEKVLQWQSRAAKVASAIASISKCLRLIIQMAMLGVGAVLVIQNQITPGVMIAGSILMSRALAPVEQAIGAWKNLIAARQSYHRLFNYFSQQTRDIADIELTPPQGEITCHNVYYTPKGMRPILKNINLKITASEMVGIIGPAASGKTTLARLIVGAWRATTGDVRLDKAEVYSYNREAFGKHIGYVPQDVELFAGTVKANIARLGEADDQAVIAAAQMAGVHDMILQLPNGYDTPIQTGEFNLSGGQRQRIALVRALYKTPRVLVLDEPNSNLDNVGELALLRAMKTMQERGSTIIVIAHRPIIVQHVDRLIVLNQGCVQYDGARDTILEKLQQTMNNTNNGDTNEPKIGTAPSAL